MNLTEDEPGLGLAGGRRPRDLALLLLASFSGPPRQRARDQQADLAGGELFRRVLDRVAALDPEADECEAALFSVVEEFGEPTGPTRGLCVRFLQEWGEFRGNPEAWSWLLNEAIEAGQGVVKRRRRDRGPDSSV